MSPHRPGTRPRPGPAALLPAAALLGALLASPPARAGNEKCLVCHGREGFGQTLPDGSFESLYVDADELAHSIHGGWACEDCHADVTEIPHQPPEPVSCTRCHYAGNDRGAPDDVDYDAYKASVHGRLAAAGDPRAPACQDCHGSHDVFPAIDGRSSIARKNIPKTCGRCHMDVYAEYSRSVHGTAVESGKAPEAAVCTDCHGEHAIEATDKEESEVSPTHLAETCAKCHASVPLMSKYGIPADRVTTYEETYHGVANRFGSTVVANCASCHGVHEILPSSDPRSPINKANIAQTCGKCHEDVNENYTEGSIHVDPHSRDSGILYWITLFFTVLTTGTMAALIAHILLDLNYRLRQRRRGHGRHPSGA